MRTLLDQAFPPNCMDETGFFTPEPLQRNVRTFSQNPVLAQGNDLVEVGVGGTVIAMPGVPNGAPVRGIGFAASEPANDAVSL